MNDLEISKALALAIGWSEVGDDPDVVTFSGKYEVPRVAAWHLREWKTFDYRDPAVIWPIAERYSAFPQKLPPSPAHGWKWQSGRSECADTAAKAVALAIIGAGSPAKTGDGYPYG